MERQILVANDFESGLEIKTERSKKISWHIVIPAELKNSADNPQTRSYLNAAVEHGKTVKVIDENLASNDDDKQIAELLLRRTDAINRRERLIKAVENAIKIKYQPQIHEIFSTVNKEIKIRFVELQQKTMEMER